MAEIVERMIQSPGLYSGMERRAHRRRPFVGAMHHNINQPKATELTGIYTLNPFSHMFL